MKSIIYLLSIIYIYSMTACNSGQPGADDHGHDHAHNQEQEQEHTDDGHEHTEDDHTDDEHEHTEDDHTDDEHEHTEDDHTDDGHEHTEDDHTDDEHEHTDQESSHESEDEHDTSSSPVDYSLLRLTPGDFSFIYKTSGMIMPDLKDEVVISATAPGLLSYSDHFLYPGVSISPGQEIFIIKGEGLSEDNTQIKLKKLKSEYLTAKENFERASKMVAERLVTQEHYLDKKLNYEQARTEYENYSSLLSGKGKSIVAPAGGYINELFAREGEMVRTGDRIASIIIEHQMVLKADIPPADLEIMKQIHSANFSTGYRNRVYSTNDLGGEIISYGKSTGRNSYYVPLYFRINYNDELIPGTFTDIWLRGDTVHNVLTVPNSAIMEEYGKHYVYVHEQDNEFEKRYVTTGSTNGTATMILSGLDEGETIVGEGAYTIKLRMQSSSLPAEHSHNH
ncbi:MAG: efflux RND transporter periplasmic adaptor subunit [Bacteroidales bacterium]|nr:efflux RND transporter periplasmic adaptor subunit [Bacteroidales bacterium]